MTKFNTLWRLFFSFGICVLLAESALAQSLLNFSRTTLQPGGQANISVTNPTPYWADVQFTLYGLDGNPATLGLVNPVNYRVPPKGQLSLLATEMFAGTNLTGWIQASSPTSGLRGFYMAGDLENADASEAADVWTRQVIPFVRVDQQFSTELAIVNPTGSNTSFTVTVFNAAGAEVGTLTQSLPAHGAMQFAPPIALTGRAAGPLSVRVDSTLPISATGVVRARGSVFYSPGQTIDQPATMRIASHFHSGDGLNPIAILTNPGNSAVTANVTLYSETGGAVFQSLTGPSRKTVQIPARGSVSLDAVFLTDIAFAPVFDGWLRIESSSIALSGLVVLEQADGITAMPLESAASDRLLYSQAIESNEIYSVIALVNPSSDTTQVDMYLVKEDGTTLASRRVEIAANSKLLARMPNLLPASIANPDAFVVMRASTGIFGTGIRGSNRFIAGMNAMDLPLTYAPDPIVPKPRINSVAPGLEVRSGGSLRVSAGNVGSNVSFAVGNQLAASRTLFPGSPTFDVDMPSLEPGFVTLRLRNDGVEAPPLILEVPPADNAPRHVLSGQAFYQKVEVNDSGLDLNRLSMVPIRNARVEVFDRSTQAVVSVSETDGRGRFRVPVPFEEDLTIRVVSRLRAAELRVSDNRNNNALYAISMEIDGRTPGQNVLIVDNSRVSGAFNILEVVQRANDVVKIADPTLVPPSVTIAWNTQNNDVTAYRLNSNTLYVSGDRSEDSDEFDDSVILHEYAHMLAVRFSRDDSPGGAHSVGDMLDPRVAWSEGWANFFSAAARNEAIYRDSRIRVLRYDLEDNIPPSDRPGYSSEASVHSLLWDLFDDRPDVADNVQFHFRAIWNAFTEIRNDRFVYLPHFLERFLARNPESENALRNMVQLRSIDFQPNARPSVTDPFPRPIDASEVVTGEVDSLTSRRSNLMQSSHFRSFRTAGGAISIRLDITGLGPGNNATANDLDLFLMDANGRVIDRSDRGLNGQSELISVRLPAGAYVIEVRSFYTRAETNGLVYNSGAYRLSLTVQ